MMDGKYFFERNVLALSKTDPRLCAQLSAAETTRGCYRFISSKTGETVPALVDAAGAAHPLHSMVDPQREAERLLSTIKEEGYLVFLGLGGGFYAAAALERKETERVLVIEYDLNGMAELLSSREYIPLFNDPRFHLMVDPSAEQIEDYFLGSYKPVLHGGIRVFPLRARTEHARNFVEAGEAINHAIESVSRDYSVQAYFGKRWFSNIIRNLSNAGDPSAPAAPIRRASITAAGPSLDLQLPRLKEERKHSFLIAADTSLPALLNAGIEPDAVISIDCQHISYQHFLSGLPEKTRLFLDLASPPTVSARSRNPLFFVSGHPFSRYIQQTWRPLPFLDTSGANVTFAALSLAENLGAEEISLYGADFSYPQGKTYARGTYIYPFFEKKQSRFDTLESLHSAFLYRSQPLSRQTNENSWYYETQSLRFYRETLEQKAARSKAILLPVPGLGPAIAAPKVLHREQFRREFSLYTQGSPRCPSFEFLQNYRRDLEETVSFSRESSITLTILPSAAAIRREYPGCDIQVIFKLLKDWCLEELDKVLSCNYTP
jgi:hypothetical protein